MKEPNDTLRDEHEIIERLLFALDGLADHIRYDKDFPERDIEEALGIAVEFADWCHHAKEEFVLFPALRKASPRRGGEIARRLTSDHMAFRKLVKAMRNAVPLAAIEDGPPRAHLAKELGLYTRLVREHIRIEEQRLLPEVERSLGRRDRAAIAAEFDRLEKMEGEPGRHRRFEDAIRRLAVAYAV